MANVIEAGLTFFIISVFAVISIGVLTNTNSANIGSCALNATGGLENCSLSTNDYNLYNSTSTQVSTIYSAISPLAWVLAAAVIVAVFISIARWT